MFVKFLRALKERCGANFLSTPRLVRHLVHHGSASKFQWVNTERCLWVSNGGPTLRGFPMWDKTSTVAIGREMHPPSASLEEFTNKLPLFVFKRKKKGSSSPLLILSTIRFFVFKTIIDNKFYSSRRFIFCYSEMLIYRFLSSYYNYSKNVLI